MDQLKLISVAYAGYQVSLYLHKSIHLLRWMVSTKMEFREVMRFRHIMLAKYEAHLGPSSCAHPMSMALERVASNNEEPYHLQQDGVLTGPTLLIPPIRGSHS
jgi:hypothetical protein